MTLMIFEMSWMFLFFSITLASVSISEKGASCLSLISHVFAHLNCFRVVVDAVSVFFGIFL